MLFRVGLTLVRLALGTTEQRLACPGLLETLGALRAIPPTQLQEEAFMSQVGAAHPTSLAAQLRKLSPRPRSQSENCYSVPVLREAEKVKTPGLKWLSVAPSAHLSAPQPSVTSWGCVLPVLWGPHGFLPSPSPGNLGTNRSPHTGAQRGRV